MPRTRFGRFNRLAAFVSFSALALSAAMPGASALTQSGASEHDGHVEAFKARHVKKWDSYGVGLVDSYHNQLVLSEGEASLGAMVVSPESYCGDIKVSFDAMALQPAAVLVASLAVENLESDELSFPEDYDGNVDYMFDNLSMYNFILHPTAHNHPGPFLRRFPPIGDRLVAAAQEPYMEIGKYHSIEVSRQANDVSLSIDGARIFGWHDETPLERGHVILRVRGTAHERGGVLIRNLEVENQQNADECS